VSDPESLLPEDHRVRPVSGYVVRQDLSRSVEAVKARGSNAGLAAIDPHILSGLWRYATLEGVASRHEVINQIDAVADKAEVYAPVPELQIKKDKQGNAVRQDTATDKHQPKAGGLRGAGQLAGAHGR
jgi:hypothetical protein